MNKVKAKDLRKDDAIQMFVKGQPMSYPFFVKTFEIDHNDKCHFRLESDLGATKNYGFIDGDYELTRWHPSPRPQECCKECGRPL